MSLIGSTKLSQAIGWLLLVVLATWTDAQVTTKTTTVTTKRTTVTTKVTTPTTKVTVTMTTTTINPALVPSSSCNCGSGIYERIVNGSLADPGEVPWQAILGYAELAGMNFYCGGVIISSQYILTAAHCIEDKWKFRTRVAFGFLDIFEPFKTYMIRHWIIHPRYHKDRYDADIALLRLYHTIQFTDMVKPICLPPMGTTESFLGKEVTISGWGATEYKGPSSEDLLETQVDIISNDVCKDKLRCYGFNDDMLCAYRVFHDSCHGDSGGPASVRARDNVYFLTGIIAVGFKCAVPGIPSALTRITSFLEWIHKNTCSPICTRPMNL